MVSVLSTLTEGIKQKDEFYGKGRLVMAIEALNLWLGPTVVFRMTDYLIAYLTQYLVISISIWDGVLSVVM